MPCKYIRCKSCSHSIGQHTLSCCMAGIPYQGMLVASLGMQSRQQLNHGLRSSIFKHVLCGWNQAGMKMTFSLSLYMCMSIWIMCIHTHTSPSVLLKNKHEILLSHFVGSLPLKLNGIWCDPVCGHITRLAAPHSAQAPADSTVCLGLRS